MALHPVVAYSVTIPSGTSQSSAINLGGSYNKLSVILPSMASGTDIVFNGSDEIAGTYRRVFHQPTVTSGTVSFVIASSVSNCIVPLPNVNLQFLKIVLTSQTVDSSYTYKILCSD